VVQDGGYLQCEHGRSLKSYLLEDLCSHRLQLSLVLSPHCLVLSPHRSHVLLCVEYHVSQAR
jgi:hypothetical protein